MCVKERPADTWRSGPQIQAAPDRTGDGVELGLIETKSLGKNDLSFEIHKKKLYFLSREVKNLIYKNMLRWSSFKLRLCIVLNPIKVVFLKYLCI